MQKPSKFQQFLIMVFIVTSVLSLSGCGTKGPLYIPEQQYPQTNP